MAKSKNKETIKRNRRKWQKKHGRAAYQRRKMRKASQDERAWARYQAWLMNPNKGPC